MPIGNDAAATRPSGTPATANCSSHQVRLRAWCVNPHEQLSPGQADRIGCVCQTYPHPVEDDFVAAHRDEWLR